MVSDSCTLVMFEVVVGGDICNHFMAMAEIVQEFAFIPGSRELCWKGSLLVAVYSHTLPYIMHFMYLCYAKEA